MIFRIYLFLGFLLLLPTFAYASAFEDPGARAVPGGASMNNGAGLEPAKSEVDGGEISVGASTQVVVLFRNTLAQPVEVGAINLYPSSTVTATVALNDCAKEKLAPGAECAIALNITAFQTGPWRVEMLVRHSGRSKVVTARVKGTVAVGDKGDDQIKADIQATPSELDFGSLTTGKPLVRSIVLRNVTSDTLTISEVSIQSSSNDEYNLETNCEKLTTGQACLVSLAWTPLNKGKSEGFVVVRHSGATSVTAIPVKGDFNPAKLEKATTFPDAMPGSGVLLLSESEIDFGSDVANETSFTVALINAGDKALELKQFRLSGAENGLTIMGKGCVEGRVLEPGAGCPLTISWLPLRTGDVRDDLQVLHTGTRGITVIPIKGKSSQAISRDSQSIIERDGTVIKQVDRYQALQGYTVTSLAATTAIISGPVGSRVVKNGEDLLLGGAHWRVKIVATGVEMISGNDKVVLLFDQSLSMKGGATTASAVASESGAATTSSATSSQATP